jgi:hypothetical protein
LVDYNYLTNGITSLMVGNLFSFFQPQTFEVLAPS